MTTTSLKWQEPGPKKSATKQTKWQAITEALQARPGEWALVAEAASMSIATHLRNVYRLDVATRNSSNGRADIYARWVA